MPPTTLWISLLPPPKQLRRHARPVILQADPARHDDRSREDQFQRLELCIRAPVIAVQEAAPLKVGSGRRRTRRRDEGGTSGQPPFGAHFGPVEGTLRNARGISPRQTRGPFRAGQIARPREPAARLLQIGGMCRRGFVLVERDRIGRGVVRDPPAKTVSSGKSMPCPGRPARVSGSLSRLARRRADTSPVCPPQAPQ